MKTDINRNISNGVAEDQKEGKEIMLKYDANIKVIFTIPLKMFCAQKCHNARVNTPLFYCNVNAKCLCSCQKFWQDIFCQYC